MSENHQHSHVVEESLQENKETKNEEKPKDELDLTQKHSSENGEEAGKEVDKQEIEYLVLDLPSLRKEIECPICLGIIRNTSTVMECMHRFCRECIHKSIRHGNKECPTCRAPCPSIMSLRDDLSFDAIIQVICPDIDKFEKEELASIEEELDLPNKKVP